MHFLIWNAHRPAARSAALREAVVELHDIRAFWQETGRPEQLLTATAFLPRRSLGRPPREHSLARAQALLARAAYAGPPLRLWVLDLPSARQEADWLAARAARLGLPMQVVPAPLDAMPDARDDVDLAFMGEIAGSDEHLSFWSALKQPELLFRRLLPPPSCAAWTPCWTATAARRTTRRWRPSWTAPSRCCWAGTTCTSRTTA
ncbi:hypothetical protein [Deinococcus aquaticus]|uniref:hypothetical protein n=1 Tax=Deinococcus aquaticus TaxID=328692 RepID=UPI003623B2D2